MKLLYWGIGIAVVAGVAAMGLMNLNDDQSVNENQPTSTAPESDQNLTDEYEDFKLIDDDRRKERDEALQAARELDGITVPSPLELVSTTCEGCANNLIIINSDIVGPHNKAFEEYSKLLDQAHALEDDLMKARNEAARQFAKDVDAYDDANEGSDDGKVKEKYPPMSPELKVLEDKVDEIQNKIVEIVNGPLEELDKKMKDYRVKLAKAMEDLKICESKEETCHPTMQVDTEVKFKLNGEEL